jgi:hypothetical protein
MTESNPCFDEVRDAHDEIARWLSGAAAAESLQGLLARFSPAYTMVTLTGARLDYTALAVFFAGVRGARPGLRIEIDELELIASGDGRAVVGYRERQRGADGETTTRRSTAVFTRDAAGRVLWLRLHETACAPD